MTKQRPLIGISAGDPAGIGPEICAKALAGKEIYDICRPSVVCDAGVVNAAVEFSRLDLTTRRISRPSEGLYEPGTIDVIDLKNVDITNLQYKKVAAATGKASFEYIKRVIDLALAGEIDATVTGPIHKEALNAAGYHYAGHTEIYAEFTHTKDYSMMLADQDFRVAHVSTHVSLRDAIDRVRKDRIVKVIQLANATLRKLAIEKPKIAVAGLNPHAGEGGMFGREEIDHIIPPIEAARAAGIDADGPIPPDTVFSKMRGGRYDLVVVMYHDQGHIPTKLSGFDYDEKTGSWKSISGVNMTLGLPIIRTSVDHGVAFGKAGEGRANPESLIQAIRMAVRLAGKD